MTPRQIDADVDAAERRAGAHGEAEQGRQWWRDKVENERRNASTRRPPTSPVPEQQVDVRIRTFSDIQPEPVQWLWPGRFALGKVAMLVGDPGLGKSFATIDMAAITSRCNRWPDGAECAGGDVLMLSAEDDPEDTIRPRLDAAGANVDRVHVLESVLRWDAENAKRVEAGVNLATDIEALQLAFDRVSPVLLIIDPITAYLGGIDSHKNAELRAVLKPIADIVTKRKVAVVAVSHLNKAGGQAIYRTMGSLAFVAAARTVWAVVKDKADESRRLMLPVKNNLAPDYGGLAFRIGTNEAGAPVVQWEPGAVQVDVNDALTPVQRETIRPERDEAAEWLREMLQNGSEPTTEIKRRAHADGFHWRTVERAKEDLGVKARRAGGIGSEGRWVWYLPNTANDSGQKERGGLSEVGGLRQNESISPVSEAGNQGDRLSPPPPGDDGVSEFDLDDEAEAPF